MAELVNTAHAGEIVKLGEIIAADTAKELGKEALALNKEYQRRLYTGNNNFLFVEGGSPEQSSVDSAWNYVRLADGHYRPVIEAQTFLDGLIRLGGRAALRAESGLFIGVAGDGRWHIDDSQDWRLLVNLSDFPVSLKVATEWEGINWGDIFRSPRNWYADQVPWHYEVLEYEPGEGVLIDNACSAQAQVPHVGSTESGKVFLRAVAVQDADS